MSEPIYHNHHIIPRHAGGTDDPSNIIRLTLLEHAEAHKVLFETYGKLEDKLAWLMLSGRTEEGEETRKILSKIASQTPEAREKRRISQLGKKASPKTIEKLRQSHLGKILSSEQKQKIGNALKNHPVSKETREKLRAAHLGKKKPPLTEEHKRQIGEYSRNRIHSQETKDKISKGNTGKIRSIETRGKISEQLKRYYQKKRDSELFLETTLC